MTRTWANSIASSLIHRETVRAVESVFHTVTRRIRLARTRRQLMNLDDRMLKDIGLLRSDIAGDFAEISCRNRASWAGHSSAANK